MPSRRYDAIVVGLGAMGSATLYHLCRRGIRALGIEQYSPANLLGSSHGDSRIIRETYFEHPLYVPLVRRAHELWRELERESGKDLMRITGGLMIGPPEGSVVTGTLRSAREHDLPYEIMDAAAVRRRFPAFQLPGDVVAVFDPRAGYLDPEACVTAHLNGAKAGGAEIRIDEKVLGWDVDGAGVRVHTNHADYLADRLVLSAGPWNSSLVPDLNLPLAIERQVLFWFEPKKGADLYAEDFPIYAYEFKPGTICYGFPRLARGVKASVMHDGALAGDPLAVEREVADHEVKELRAALRPVLPGLADAPVRDSAVCLFTNTPDHDFIIDFHPRYPQVLISSPCSGHGFKFSSAIGELQAQLVASGRSAFDLSAFRIGRLVRAQ